MKKINLLLSHNNWNSFNNHWIINVLHDFFKVIYIEDNPVFDKTNTIIMFSAGGSDWINEFQDQNYKIVTEQLWNSGKLMPLNNSMFLTNKNWFWYSESLYYMSVGHDQYIPNRTYNKLAFMPMWSFKSHRDLLFDRLTEMIQKDSLIFSYVAKDIYLPHDDPSSPTRYNYFESVWYNDTHFSIVAETRVDLDYLFISEKTYKPIAFYHPFILIAQPKILEHLRNNGFETYENLFDESYDLELDFNVRFEKIISNIKNYNKMPYDKITQDKLQHNHHLFFNKDIIMERFTKEIINPILEYFETKQ
jgi:hypothetical protein